jgi:hypothetical protein
MYTIYKHSHHEPAMHIVMVDAGTVGSGPSIAKLLFPVHCALPAWQQLVAAHGSLGSTSWLKHSTAAHTLPYTHTQPHPPDSSTLLVDPMSFVPGGDDFPPPPGVPCSALHSAVLSPLFSCALPFPDTRQICTV